VGTSSKYVLGACCVPGTEPNTEKPVKVLASQELLDAGDTGKKYKSGSKSHGY
jgi:hypothetical protein